MLFNSIQFAIFLPLVFTLFWFVFKKKAYQNGLLLVASYVFYGWWDWRFLSLIALSTIVDFITGGAIFKATSKFKKKAWLAVSVVFNLGLLGVLKYFNFFATNLASAFQNVGYELDDVTLNIVLPVGISFYTFQTMSYSLDIYNNKIEPTRNFLSFAAFISFFPQLVAGPIERASNLLPQFLNQRVFSFDKAFLGLQLIVWGLFKKVVIADTLAPIVNQIFDNPENFSSGTLVLGMIYFSVQIYGDFSGYSDIAIGVASLFGFQLCINFNFPYFASNISDFWRRWHISLSSWFRDYVYIPLGGSKNGKWKSLRNVLIIFVLSGFWHGANWTFIIWGSIHGLLFLPFFIWGKSSGKELNESKDSNGFTKGVMRVLSTLMTFTAVAIAWVFFRADSAMNAFGYLKRIATNLNGSLLQLEWKKELLLYVIPLFVLDFLYFKKVKVPVWLKYVLLLVGFEMVVIHLLKTSSQEFIYFDF